MQQSVSNRLHSIFLCPCIDADGLLALAIALDQGLILSGHKQICACASGYNIAAAIEHSIILAFVQPLQVANYLVSQFSNMEIFRRFLYRGGFDLGHRGALACLFNFARLLIQAPPLLLAVRA